MTLTEVIFASPALRALGWALLHSLWQGALVALLLAGVQTLLRGRAASVRYAAACAALLLMLLLPAATFLTQGGPAGGAKVDEMSLQTPPPQANAGAAPGQTGRAEGRTYGASKWTDGPLPQRMLTARLDPVLPWLSLAWLLGVLGLTARVFGGLAYTRRLTRAGNRPLEAFWQERLERLSEQLRLRQAVRLLESQLVRVPTTVGWLRPVILLPASALTGLTPAQLELILAHELAHIRRQDYLVNLFQVLVETLLFYHPAAWWVSRQVRAEREHACDDLAVAVGGDAVAYARALTKVERLRRQRPLLAVAADGGKLNGRVRRLVEKSQGHPRPASPLLGLLLVAAFFTSVVYAHGVISRQKQTPPADDARSSITRETALADEGRDRAASERRALAEEMASLVAGDETSGEDEEVRRVALEALGGRAGSVVVLNPKTGRVYAVVNQEWAVRKGFKPASTIKLVTAAAAVADRKLAEAVRVRGSANAKALDLTEALARSDNSYFGSLGQSVGAERLLGYAREFGFGETTGINYEGESAGTVPTSFGGDASGLGAYGDGIEVTPVQLAVLVSAIANGGALVVPRVPRTTEEAARFDTQVRRRLGISREYVERLIPGMIAAVKHGTGRAASTGTQKVAGKTGTSVDDKSPVGIFASYAPSDDPRLVVVVVTRGENENGPAAAGVAGAIYRALNRRP